MPTTKRFTTERRSRVGKRLAPVPPPLRFKSVKDAVAYIKANKLKVTEHHTHTRGARIQVVDAKGKARTISIERRKNAQP